jgi:hypothetical protein
MSPEPQEPIVGTFASLVRRSLPPVGAFGSAILGVPRAFDHMITSGSLRNARDAVAARTRMLEIGQALEFSREEPDGPDAEQIPRSRTSTR